MGFFSYLVGGREEEKEGEGRRKLSWGVGAMDHDMWPGETASALGYIARKAARPAVRKAD